MVTIKLDGQTQVFTREVKDVLNAPNFTGVPTQMNMVQNQDGGVTHIKDASELGDALKELNRDEFDNVNKTSSIDMRSVLSRFDIPNILVVDMLITLGLFDEEMRHLTSQKKRLAVSVNGRGRADMVQLSSGKSALDVQKGGGSIVDAVKGAFKRGE